MSEKKRLYDVCENTKNNVPRSRNVGRKIFIPSGFKEPPISEESKVSKKVTIEKDEVIKKVSFKDVGSLIACYVNIYVQEEKGDFPGKLLFDEVDVSDSRLKKYYDCEVRMISPNRANMGCEVMNVYLNDKEEKVTTIDCGKSKRKRYKITGRKLNQG